MQRDAFTFGLPEMLRLVEGRREERGHKVLPPLLYGLGNQTGREGALDEEEGRVCHSGDAC